MVREWNRADVPLVAAIDRECFGLEPWSETEYAKEFSSEWFCGTVLEMDGEIVGYVCGKLVFEDAEILRIAVKNKWRGQGLGGTLLNGFIDSVKTRGGTRVFLEVRTGNVAAVRLYRSRGFTLTRERKKYYADGEDALEMKKDL